MLLSVYCIYDSAVLTWRTPIFSRSKGEFLRMFIDACNDPQSALAKHPADYTAFEIGTFNDDNCKFDLYLTPVSIGKAIEYIKVPGSGAGSPG